MRTTSSILHFALCILNFHSRLFYLSNQNIENNPADAKLRGKKCGESRKMSLRGAKRRSNLKMQCMSFRTCCGIQFFLSDCHCEAVGRGNLQIQHGLKIILQNSVFILRVYVLFSNIECFWTAPTY